MNLFKPWITTVLLLLSLQTIAQKKSKALRIGDKVPDLEFKGIYNYPTTTAKLSDFRGKAVILDFWSKVCSSCIAGFPKLQRIQDEFKDDLVILLINQVPEETREVLALLFKNSPILRDTKLPIVLGDETYSRTGELFPRSALGTHVWIDKNGIIQASTYGHEATRDEIQKLIKGEKLSVSEINHIYEPVNFNSILNLADGKFINKLLVYRNANFNYVKAGYDIDLTPLNALKLGDQPHSLLMKDPNSGNYTGGPFGEIVDSENKIIGRRLWKVPVSMHYNIAFGKEIGFGLENIIVEGDEVLNLDEWYAHEFIDPDYTDSIYRENLKQDLENHFGYKGEVEVRHIESYILFRTGKALKLPKSKRGTATMLISESTQTGFFIKDTHIGNLRFLIANSKRDRNGCPASVIDETGITESDLTITVNGKLDHLLEMNKSLSKYGLGIKKEPRLLPALVLRKVNRN